MQKILNPSVLGISGRQSELIELAMTYGFRGLDIDVQELQRRAQSSGFEQARQFLQSAKLIVSSFLVPCAYAADEATQKTQLEQLEKMLEVGASLNAKACFTHIEPASDELPFHENFEFHRTKLGQMAELAAKYKMTLGVGCLAAASHRADRAYQFIYQPDQLLMLVKMISASNIGVILDTWNWHVGSGNLDIVRQLRVQDIVGVRLADIPTTVDLASVTEDQRVIPGEGGGIDNVAVLNYLADIKYEGPVTIEVSPAALRGSSREATVQRIAKVFDAQFQAAGLSKSGKRLTASTS